MKIDQVKRMVQVEVKIIEDVEKYRGFYFELEDGCIQANFCSNVKAGLEVKYSLGFDTNGKSDIEHLYAKLKNSKKLTKFEKVAFYENVNLFNPSAQRAGKWYNFREVLHKVKGLEFYTLLESISKKEIAIFNESNISDVVDIEGLTA